MGELGFGWVPSNTQNTHLLSGIENPFPLLFPGLENPFPSKKFIFLDTWEIKISVQCNCNYFLIAYKSPLQSLLPNLFSNEPKKTI